MKPTPRPKSYQEAMQQLRERRGNPRLRALAMEMMAPPGWRLPSNEPTAPSSAPKPLTSAPTNPIKS